MCQGNGSGEKMSPGNVSRKWVREKMSPGNGSRKWVLEKISFTDSSFTDTISSGNAQMYGPIIYQKFQVESYKCYFKKLG